jgi:serine/threonine protein kinase
MADLTGGLAQADENGQYAIGRYVLCEEIAAGGMATIHLGRLVGPAGFARIVAIKRMHPQYAKDPDFASMFLDEARLAARVRHPNVVPTLEVVSLRAELFLVMEYVEGESLARLVREAAARGVSVPPAIAVAILIHTLEGLHAAHEARGERGEPLEIAHRDVSPQNILVGADGVARVLDFGIAKAAGRLHTTREGQVKGKASYMAPEQVRGHEVDRRADVYAAAVVLWETLTGERLFVGDTPMGTMAKVLERDVPPPGRLLPEIPAMLDAAVLRGLARDRTERFQTAREMALALESALAPATTRQVSEWVAALGGDAIAARSKRVAEIESSAPPDGSPSLDDRLAQEAVEAEIDARTPPTTGFPPRRRVLAVAGALAAALALVLAARYIGERGATAAAASAWHDEATPSSPPIAGPFPSFATASGPVGAPSASARTPAILPSRRPPVAPTARPPTAAPRRNCSPPYTLDPEGVRVAKPECL